ncbi:MAG TPA: hypothetical protein VKB65_04630 [Myxococcota bacterium]|nr:hypothetical protein [Myxococcota bacterium]
MIHRRLRLLGLALAVAASWAIAPVTATADDHRGDRYEHRGHDRGNARDRDRHDRDRKDRWDRRSDHDRKHRYDRRSNRDRFERRGPPRAFAHNDRHRRTPPRAFAYNDRHRWAPPRYAKPLPHRFYPHARARGSWPFYCREHHHGFHDRRRFDEHLVHFHHLPYWQLPRLVAHVGFGWTFGY